jgi:hypothetical protein
MKKLAILGVLLSSTALADPTTQSCLGNLDTLLTCPQGAARSGTECRARDAGHWSGSKRQGPSVFLRDNKTVSFAANYKDHKKTGRVYRFDDQGRLESWSDMKDDLYDGLSVTCLPNGHVWYLANYKNDKVVGISRSWKANDGSFSYAMDHDASGHSISIQATADQMKRPDALCQPVKCDVTQSSSRSNAASASSTDAVR